MLVGLFESVLVTSLAGSAAALIFLAARPVTRKYFSAFWHYCSLIAVLFVMVLPLRIYLPQAAASNTAAKSGEIYVLHTDNAETVTGDTGERISEKSTALSALMRFTKENIRLFACIWSVGAILLLLFGIIGYSAFISAVRRNSRIVPCPQISRYTKRQVTVIKSDSVASPMMTGMLRPTLILPDTEITENRLDCILMHEMTHLRHGDILLKRFAFAVKCLHWFNPLVYRVVSQMILDCEIACDLAVVKGMTREEVTGYTDTILTLVCAAKGKLPQTIAGMASDKTQLKRRFMMIKNRKDTGRKAAVISLALAIVVLGSTVFASGILGGMTADDTDTKKGPKSDDTVTLEKTADGNTAITYDTKNGDILSVESYPVLLEDKTEKDTDTGTEDAESVAFVCPCEGIIRSVFGKRVHPITGEERFHNGIDIGAPEGTQVVSAINGTVSDMGYNAEKGNYIVVERGNVITEYSHLSELLTEKGSSTAAGDIIGLVGSTGKSTGPHLHFVVKVDGEYIDPSDIFEK